MRFHRRRVDAEELLARVPCRGGWTDRAKAEIQREGEKAVLRVDERGIARGCFEVRVEAPRRIGDAHSQLVRGRDVAAAQVGGIRFDVESRPVRRGQPEPERLRDGRRRVFQGVEQFRARAQDDLVEVCVPPSAVDEDETKADAIRQLRSPMQQVLGRVRDGDGARFLERPWLGHDDPAVRLRLVAQAVGGEARGRRGHTGAA